MLTQSMNLELLNIEGVQIKLDDILGKHKQLRELNVKSNKELTTLPKVIGEYHSLEIIELSNSGLKVLAEEIGNCTNLEGLYLNDSMIHELPSSLGNCQHLEILELRNSRMKSLPEEIGNCIGLKSIKLFQSEIASLPTSIGNCSKLEKLEVCQCLNLKELPLEIINCSMLEEIHIGPHPIAFPAELLHVKPLRIIYHKNIVESSSSFNVSITELPEIFFSCRKLKYSTL